MNALHDRSLPRADDAEQLVIGCALAWPEYFHEIRRLVKAEDFFLAHWRAAFESLTGLADASQPMDQHVLVGNVATKCGLERYEAKAYLAEATTNACAPKSSAYYCQRIRDAATRRMILQTADEVRGAVDESDINDSAADLLADVANRFHELASERQPDVPDADGIDAVIDGLKEAERILNGESIVVHSGIDPLDDLTGGFQAGQLVVIAARTSQGKTALGTTIANNAAKRGSRSLFISLEMTRIEMGWRLASLASGVPLFEFRKGLPNDRHLVPERMGENGTSVKEVRIVDRPRMTVNDIAAEARRKVRSGGLNLLVVDYLGLIQHRYRNENSRRDEAVGETTRQLKAIAKELHIPVLCLAQLNRESAKESDPTPKLHHLRDSGNIEQDADLVVLIHRPEAYLTAKELARHEAAELRGKAKLIVAKNRNGATGAATVAFHKETAEFRHEPCDYTGLPNESH